jgi:hypothetical protein
VNIKATTSYSVAVTKGEIIRLVKELNQDNIALRALPDSGSDVRMDVEGGAVVLRFSKESGRHD